MKFFKEKLVAPFIVGMMLMAIGASAKAIVDVHVLQAENVTIKKLLTEVRNDVKEIYKHTVN